MIIDYKGMKLESIEIKLPGTTFIILKGQKGFFMCGALNVDIYNSLKMKDRKVLCANVVGVKTVEDLLNGKLNQVSDALKEKGAYEGMSVDEALVYIS